MRKFLLLTCLSILVTAAAFAQSRFWTPNNENRSTIAKDKSVARLSFPTEFNLFNLNAPALRQELLSITGASRMRASTIISLPNADGGIEEFEVMEASNFEPDLQAQFPEIRAFSGKGITDKYATVKLSISPEGMQSMVFRTEKDNEFIEPYSADHKIYSVYKAHREKGKLPWTCSTNDKQVISDVNSKVGAESVTLAVGASSGQLKTLRLAQSCNGEYANYFGAKSAADVAKVLAAFNATLTRCNGVFEKDLATHLSLIAATTSVIYYNPSTDPYTSLSNWNLQLQQTLTSVIGSANYDIGHMFGASGGGGNAGCIGCVCVNPANSRSLGKGSGITSPADGVPSGDNFDIDYVAHEMGHQLGANHTFSFSLEGTGQNKEVGSGITIMGYAGITSYDVAPHSIDIFHATSIAQIQANLANKTCPVTTNIAANNTAPSIAPVSNYTIPISTPFALTGSASDAQLDALTYCWEQNDNATTSGSGSVASPTKTTGPNWLSFPASASPTRTFPKLETILAGLNVTPRLPGGDAVANIEALSSVSRTLNFRLTVRDNHPYTTTPVAVGQTAFTDVVVTVTSTAGPFKVTSPNTNVSLAGNSPATITWSVNGTNAGSVNCASVNILLSTDGGNTFPVVLASSTPNDGSEVVTIPNTPGTTNRIKVEAVGNIFFDISDANFTIGGSAPTCGNPSGLGASTITETSATLSWAPVSGANSYAVDYKVASSNTWISAATATTNTSFNLSGLSASTVYDWRVRANCTSDAGNYVQSQFTTATPQQSCGVASGLTASNITQTSASLSWTAVSGAVSYAVDYKAAASSTWIDATSATITTSVNLSGLTAGTAYDWRVTATCPSGTGNSVQAQFTTLAAAVTCPGSYDNAANGTIEGASLIPFNTDIYGTIGVRNEIDHYKFTTTGTGSVTISLTTLPADYQLSLLNASGTVMQSSTNNSTSNESINRELTAGTYYVKIYPKSNGAFNATNCYTLRVQTGTASRMSDLLVSNSLMVMPNPTVSKTSLRFVTTAGGSATVSVISQSGEVVLTKTLSVNAGDNTRELDVSTLASGVYFVRVQSGSVSQMARLVVVK